MSYQALPCAKREAAGSLNWDLSVIFVIGKEEEREGLKQCHTPNLQLLLTPWLSITGAAHAASNDMGGKRGASYSWDALNAHRNDRQEQGKCRPSPQNHTYLHSVLLPRSLKARKMWRLNYCGFPPWIDEIS